MVVRSIDLLGCAAAVQWRSFEEEQRCRLLGIYAPGRKKHCEG